MNILQPRLNPIPNPNILQPRLNPIPNPNAGKDPATKSLSFDEISKVFSLPLSDAADSLGVCISVLKKSCHDNGLVRWPYRKVLAGKSIEEIKAAVIVKSKEVAEMAGIAGERGSVQQMSKSQPQGSKNSETGNFQNVNTSNFTKGTLDEFKYGFPSDGLSTVSYRWWGNTSPDDDNNEDSVHNRPPNADKSKNCADESTVDARGTSSLSAIRRRTTKEGKAALKLGVYRGSGVNKLEWTKRGVLLQIFKSSLPNEWEYGSS